MTPVLAPCLVTISVVMVEPVPSAHYSTWWSIFGMWTWVSLRLRLNAGSEILYWMSPRGKLCLSTCPTPSNCHYWGLLLNTLELRSMHACDWQPLSWSARNHNLQVFSKRCTLSCHLWLAADKHVHENLPNLHLPRLVLSIPFAHNAGPITR